MMKLPSRRNTLIYIDSNIYLRFYDSKGPNFKELLNSLEVLNDKLFVTDQIVYEVIRNKANVFEYSFRNFIKQASMSDITIPVHLDRKETNEIKEWNRKRAKLVNSNQALVDDLNQIFNATLRMIIASSDEVSLILEKLFSNPIKESEQEYKSAAKRRERGNPPGKKNDTLGDQINWEQLINAITDIDTLVIVSNDNDYFIRTENELNLNPILNRELIKVNPEIRILCFNKLSDALKSVNDNSIQKLPTLPRQAVIEEIHLEEEEEVFTEGTTMYPYGKDCSDKLDKLDRIQYLFKHAMIGSLEVHTRLLNLGLSKQILDTMHADKWHFSEIRKIIKSTWGEST